MKADVTTLDAKKAGDITLDDGVFGVPVRADILHRMVVWQQNKKRAGNHKVQSRGEVNGSTKKIYRQKGTGSARHSDRKPSLFRGGAPAFGPKVRSHATKLPKKIRKLALKTALSAKLADGKLVVIDSLSLKDAKTKDLGGKLDKLGWSSVLFIDGTEVDKNFSMAAQNLVGVDVLPSQGSNVYDILRRDTVVLSKAAVENLEARLK
jgi:large subunit ribosomal protein L4